MSASGILERWARAWKRFGLADGVLSPIELSLVVTCILLSQDDAGGQLVIILGIAGLVVPPLRRMSAFWIVIGVILARFDWQNWWAISNHKYLITYWTLALGLSLLTSDPDKTMAWNARMLVGLAFLLAVLQKVAAGDFLDGSFIHFVLLKGQPSFRPVTEWIGGLPWNVSVENRHAVEDMVLRFDSTATVVQLQGTTRLAWMALPMTWWTAGIEIAVAAGFLLPIGVGISKWRDFALLAFLFTTYVIAQVQFFGWVLVAMGIAQCDPRSRALPLLYVLAFLAIVVYTIPLAASP